MLQFEPETHPYRGHGELEEPSLGGDVKESGKEQTEEGSERLSPKACHAPSVCVAPQEGLQDAGWRGRELSDSAGAPDDAVGEDLGLTC